MDASIVTLDRRVGSRRAGRDDVATVFRGLLLYKSGWTPAYFLVRLDVMIAMSFSSSYFND